MIRSVGRPGKRSDFLFSIPWSGCFAFSEEAVWPGLSPNPFHVRRSRFPLLGGTGACPVEQCGYITWEKQTSPGWLCAWNRQITHAHCSLFFSLLVFIFWPRVERTEWTQVVSNGWVPLLLLLVTPPCAWKPAVTWWAASTVQWGKTSLAFDVLQAVRISFLCINLNLGLQKSTQ